MNTNYHFALARRPVDLHTHSTRSDGSLSPTQVVEAAAARGVRALALTDHDTVQGVPEAAAAAQARGIELISGIELTVWHHRELHLLAYFIDIEHNELLDRLDYQRESRVQRIHQMCALLGEQGVFVDPLRVLATADGAPGRPHIARALIEAGHVSSFDEAFTRYLGNEGVAYVPARHFNIGEAIALVHRAGGVAVIAHPGVDGLTDHIHDLAPMGLDGIECEHPAHRPRAARRFRSIARQLNLAMTGGSDFHTPNGKAQFGDCGVDLPALEDLRGRAQARRLQHAAQMGAP